MRQPAVPQQVVHAADGAGFLVPRTENHGGDAGSEDRPRTHDARLEGRDERRLGELPRAERRRRVADRQHFRVRGRVFRELALIAAASDHRTVGPHDDGPHRDVTRGEARSRFVERLRHDCVEFRHRRTSAVK